MPEILLHFPSTPCNPSTAQADALPSATIAQIQAAIEHLKQVRFHLEREGNLTGLQQLEDAMLSELDLLEATQWGVQHRKVNAIFAVAS